MLGARKHRRFMLAFGFGSAVATLAQALPLTPELRALIGANAFFISYLGLMFHFALRAAPEDLRRHAEETDEGVALILLLAAAAVGISLTAIVLVLNGPGGGALFERFLALAAVPLGWATMQTLSGFHYARLFYRSDDGTQHGGLVFPGADQPDAWDFLYFAFGVGMTAQVSDVMTDTPAMRRVVMFHAVGSFFYNTVILALAVNAAVTAGG